MKKMTFAAALFVIGVFAVGSVQAQTPKRIDFAKEGCCLVWEERVPAGGSKSFVFHAKKGQKLTLSMIDDTNQGSMDLGKVSIEPNADPTEMTIDVTKDYMLYVANNSNKATSFRISISLENVVAPKPAAPKVEIPADAERIRFANGAIEANLERTVPANLAKRFVFWAKAGQEINLTVTPKVKSAKLDVVLDDKVLPQGKLYSTIATRTGDYLIHVGNFDERNRQFTLDIGIAAPPEKEVTAQSGESVAFEDDSAALTRDIGANGTWDFLIPASRGQQISIQIGYEGKASNVQAFLTEPGLQDISLSMGPESRKEFTVKRAGDHRLTVNNMSGKKITLTVYIDIDID